MSTTGKQSGAGGLSRGQRKRLAKKRKVNGATAPVSTAGFQPKNNVTTNARGPRKQRFRARNAQNMTAGRAAAMITGTRGVFPIGKDPRSPADTGVTVPIGSNIVPRAVPIHQPALAATAFGIIARAIDRGASYPDVDLWQAYNKLIAIFTQAFQGEKIDVVSLPPFMWELIASFSPKKVPFKTGYVEYAATLQGVLASYGNQWTYNVEGPLTWMAVLGPIGTAIVVNGFNVIDLTPPVYDDAVASQALSTMWSRMGIIELVTFQAYKPLQWKDVSAYAENFPALGRDSGATVGAVKSILSSEVFIQSPILGKYSQDPDAFSSLDPKRGSWEFHVVGGGPMYVGARATEFSDMKQFRNKGFTFFKFFDFFHIYDRVVKILGRMKELNNLNPNPLAKSEYPLSSQQLALMLRWVCMRACSNTFGIEVDQLDADASNVNLVPFAVGAVSTYRQAVEPFLPSFVVENIRAVKRHVYVAFSGEVDSVPILCGRPETSYFEQIYTIDDGGGNPVPFFPLPGAEVPVEIIDCSFVDTIRMWFNNDGPTMTKLINLHNDWVTEYSSYCGGKETVGTEAGSYILLPGYQTLRIQTAPAPEPPLVTTNVAKDEKGKLVTTTSVAKRRLTGKKHPRVIGMTVERKVGAPLPPFDQDTGALANDSVIATTVMYTPFAAAWKYQQCQWCPVYQSNDGAGKDNLTWYRNEMMEPCLISESSQIGDFDTTSLLAGTVGDRNAMAAEYDVKSPLAEKSEWQRDCDQLAWSNKGGVVGFLGNLLGTAIGVPYIGKAARKLDKMF